MPVVPGLTDLSVFARGGYATVYRATQISVGREVAVKIENRTLDSERDQQRFVREARAAGRMSSHPHVVDLFDVGMTSDGHPYLIMEMCDGSYAERMRHSPLGAAEARDVGVKIADALADAHHLGVLHRDVKPANILYSRFNEPALADFGLAVLAEARDSSVTLEVLTPAYAPPEMFRHEPPSPAVDVYALCATLYAVMHGKPPRWRADLNPSLITLMELFDKPIPGLPGIPAALIDVLRQGMSNDPARRPTAERLRDMLAAVPLGPAAGAPPGTVSRPHHPAFSGGETPRSVDPAIGDGAAAGSWSAAGSSGSGPAGAWSGGTDPRPWSGGTDPRPGNVGRPPGDGWPAGHVTGDDDHPTVPTSTGSPGTGYPRRSGPAQQSGPVQRSGPAQQSGPAQWSDSAQRPGPPPPSRPGQRPSWKRRILVGLSAFVLLAGVAGGTWYLARRDVSDPPGVATSPTPTATLATTAPQVSPPSGSAGGALPGCLSPLPGAGRCPGELECFDPVRVRRATAQAERVSCTGRHTWEAYAVGDLAAELDGADHETVKADRTVRQVCSEHSFRATTLLMTTTGWQFEVLPPTAEAVAAGDRSFRCLAGRGANGLSRPTLGR